VLVVGLTGGIGAGKSTAAAAFASRGAEIVDVDRLGHLVLEPGGRAHDEVLEVFGTVDRRSLGTMVFADPDLLARLTAISHPAINAELGDRLRDLAGELPRDGVVVLDMAILAESNLGKGMYDVVVTVEAPIELRVERAVARGMAEEDVRRRIAAQASEDDRRALAAHVLVNDADEAALAARIDEVWDDLVSRARR
jgi:dephospho-CoA kinase